MKSVLKKAIALVLTFAMLMSVMTAVTLTASAQSIEDISATEIVLDQEQTISILEGGQKAYFLFTPEKSGKYFFESYSGTDTKCYLYDSNMEYLSEDDDEGAELNFLLQYYFDAGETYVMEAFFLDGNMTGEFRVKLYETLVESIEVEPITIYPYENGYFATDDARNRYFHNTWDTKISAVITMKDGTVLYSESNTSIEYNGNSYGFAIYDTQSYENQWQGGNTYIGTIEIFGYEKQVQINVLESPIKEIIIHDNELIENMGGSMFDDGMATDTDISREFFRYEWWNNLDFTAVMKDGQEIDGSGSGFWYNDEWYGLNGYDTQSFETPWVVGNTYSAQIFVLGYKKDLEFTIVSSPIERIEFDVVEVIENYDGDQANDWNEETGEWDLNYFEYYWWNKLSYKIYFKNGETVEDSGSYFEYDGKYYYFEYEDPQDYYNQWKLGETHTVKCSIMGYTADVQVTVGSSPIESVVIEPISIIEKTDGYYVGSKYIYQWYDNLEYTITFKNGDVVRDTGTGFWLDDEWVDFYYEDPIEEWVVGETYNAPLSVMGFNTSASVTITESPVESIQVDDISIIEFTDGYYDGMEDDQYYRYNWWEKLSGKITFKNGDVISFYGTSFEYDGDYYSVDYYDDQCYEERMVAGEAYEKTISVLGKEAVCNVEIKESPVESITVDTISIPFDMDYYTQSQYNPETGNWDLEYKHYNWESKVAYTITLKNGEVIKGFGMEAVIDGETYYFRYNDDQCYEEQWLPGGTYTIPISVLGASTTVTVRIVNRFTDGDYTYVVQNDSAIIVSYKGDEKAVTVPTTLGGYPVTGITSISCNAEEIVIPNSIKSISLEIFAGCKKLKKVTIGNGISFLNNNIFSYCPNLTEIKVYTSNENYKTVDGVLYNKDLTAMVAIPRGKTNEHTVPATVKDIERYIRGLYDFPIILQNTLTGYLKENGVIYNAAKTKVIRCDTQKTGTYKMPNTVTEISNNAFENSNLTSVTVSNKVTEIVYYAFAGSLKLESVTLPEGIKSISEGAFRDCEKLTTVSLPTTLKKIGGHAFEATGLKSVTVPQMVTDIDYAAFRGSNLSKISLNEGLKNIGAEAFKESKIKTIVLPNSVVNLGNNVFMDTPLTSAQIGSGVTYIPNCAFANTDLESIVIPENVKSIGEYAFMNSPLSEVDFKNNKIAIGEGAFYQCPIKDLVLKEGMTRIESYAFYGIEDDSLEVPESVTDITYRCFENSKNLLTIDISDNIMSLDGYAFHGTAWYNSQPDGPVYLEDSFYGYKGKAPVDTVVTIKEGTRLIADYAFENQVNLKKVIIPESVQYIGDDAFHGCYSLEEIEIDENNEYFEYADDCLYDSVGNYYWAKYYGIEGCYDLQTEFEYGASFSFGYDARICFLRAFGEDWCSLWSFTEFASGFNSKIPGEQEITIDLGKYKYNYTVTVNECEHPETQEFEATPSTCKTHGNEAYEVCLICDEVISGSNAQLPLADCEYKPSVTKATLSVDGKIENKCVNCGDVESTEVIYHPSSIKLSKTSYTYNGKVQTPEVIVKDTKGNLLTEGTDYTVSYTSGRKAVGTYYATVAFKGNYSGTKKLSYKINAISASKCSAKLSYTSYTYNGKVKSPTVTVKNASGTTLKNNTHYTVKYASGRKYVGKYKVTITFKGNYTGTKTLYFTINPAKTTVSKLTPGKKNIKVYITKKTSQVTGYQIQYSTSKTFKSYKTKTISSYKTTSTTLSSLSAKKTYYVRVRTYKTVNGTRYYSGWSTYKYTKTK